MGGKRVLGVICGVCVNIPALFPLEKQQQNPEHGSCPLPVPLAWCRDIHKNLQQNPPSDGSVCPQDKGHLKGSCGGHSSPARIQGCRV